MSDQPFTVRRSHSRIYPWEWVCLLRKANEHGQFKLCGLKRLAKSHAEAQYMAEAHRANLHPQTTPETP